MVFIIISCVSYSHIGEKVKREEMPHQYYVDMTRRLLNLKRELLKWAKSQNVEYDVDITLKKTL